jgi:hypothetical protein
MAFIYSDEHEVLLQLIRTPERYRLKMSDRIKYDLRGCVYDLVISIVDFSPQCWNLLLRFGGDLYRAQPDSCAFSNLMIQIYTRIWFLPDPPLS